VSVSAFAFRFPLDRLETEVPRIRATVDAAIGPRAAVG
jgi:hypothetical protein